ncbi:MAG: hypothetical protein WAQ28_07895 [Bacteroidia bacterium]|jgi:ribulose 1,5-bisphosphate carboxylase large subunit-like protein
MMVEVFKTSVSDAAIAGLLIQKIQESIPGVKVSFDLEDCDKVLRVEGAGIKPLEVMQLLDSFGHYCEVLL